MSMVETTGSTQVAQSKPPSFGVQLKEREGQFQAALPAHIPVERFMRVVMTAIQNNPKLAQADRASLWMSSVKAAQDGLLPDGREGALVIYNTKDGSNWIEKVQWMPMVAGIRKKVRNSGEIATWDAHVVYANDQFEYELGDEPYIKHKPNLKGPSGEVIAAYSVATLKSGEKSREVMTRQQIERVRAASKSKDRGPWVDWFDEMCRKTVARRHSKVLPMSTDLDDLIRRDDALYDLEGARDEARSAKVGKLTMAERFDMLASPQETPTPTPEGEIEVATQAEAAEQGEAASEDATPPPDPHTDLIARLMSVALNDGPAPLRTAIKALSSAEAKLLTGDDKRRLDEAAVAADQQGGR